MERKLAAIEVIKAIEPIPGADSIEKATVLGWSCVIRKGDFKVGDVVIFIEPDSVLPDRPEFSFLKDKGFRVKTIKLRGQVSQGLVFPLSILPKPYDQMTKCKDLSKLVGKDVTEILGIAKYEPNMPEQLRGKIKGKFPDFFSKTDETRLQSLPELLEKHKGKKFYISEKIDGSSFSCYWRNFGDTGAFGVCSRNMELGETEDNAFWKTAKKYNLKEKLQKYGRNLAIQGEMTGPGIQGNKYARTELHLSVFNVYDIDLGRCVDYTEFRRVCKDLELETVPIVDDDFTLAHTVDQLVEMSKANSVVNLKIPREGIIFRPLVGEYSEELRGKLSFKVISPLFLLKYGE